MILTAKLIRYIDASKLMQSIKKEAGSFTETLELYQIAHKRIVHINADYVAWLHRTGQISGLPAE